MCLLRWLWILLPGTRYFVAQHYTRARFSPQFEIFIAWICFSDTPPSAGSADLACKLVERFALCNLPSSV